MYNGNTMWGQGVIHIVCYNGMAVFGQGLHQEFGYIIDRDVIDLALHRTKQVVVKGRD